MFIHFVTINKKNKIIKLNCLYTFENRQVLVPHPAFSKTSTLNAKEGVPLMYNTCLSNYTMSGRQELRICQCDNCNLN
jgi:hypothetical protein